MLSGRDEVTSPLDAAHRAKLAYIYIRQSTAGQVRQHQESTTLQYRLVERAAGLGWPRERVVVVDDDLGKSGTASTDRRGFQRLVSTRKARTSWQRGCPSRDRPGARWPRR